MLTTFFLPRLLEKVQMQGGAARHCGMRASSSSARPEPAEGRIAEWAGGYVAAHTFPFRRRRETLSGLFRQPAKWL